jgi:hypothetical protein
MREAAPSPSAGARLATRASSLRTIFSRSNEAPARARRRAAAVGTSLDSGDARRRDARARGGVQPTATLEHVASPEFPSGVYGAVLHVWQPLYAASLAGGLGRLFSRRGRGADARAASITRSRRAAAATWYGLAVLTTACGARARARRCDRERARSRSPPRRRRVPIVYCAGAGLTVGRRRRSRPTARRARAVAGPGAPT